MCVKGETALLEKLVETSMGAKNAFTPVWLSFITYTAQQEKKNPLTEYKSIMSDMSNASIAIDWSIAGWILVNHTMAHRN